MKKLLALMSLSALAACQTPEQAAQVRAMQEQADIQTCLNYGFRPKTEAFAQCRLELEIARQNRYNHAYDYHYGIYDPHFDYSHWLH